LAPSPAQVTNGLITSDVDIITNTRADPPRQRAPSMRRRPNTPMEEFEGSQPPTVEPISLLSVLASSGKRLTEQLLRL